ncbi:MAG: DNA polymerase III subunit alpha [Candidatus Taylorbacteria bacterium RIFCSPHIGHO2_01_FULL_46_22b]|uniref:DNA polymerase III subunit alpha n=1 Tax=Candidatus Taylorbacteria bacterium RIFCSPHIGHO2_01_FULL_46_22b TaxID=1802301 RepID=A0A1G2M4J1_9BACT|nr:MAG: DNA polymerase III subunit alpha [Candidatus Taylorbacteria bacterium RIFCSPHIGHO2_01_FULL_46_22b]
MSKFVHLHIHSHYSLLSALPKIPDLVTIAKESGMKTLALTDLGNLYGAVEFYKECQDNGIKPIIGVEAYTAARTRTDRQAGIDNRRGRLVLLAENLEGYKNLLKLVTQSALEGFYYRPRVDRELLETYAKGLIAISPAYNGDIAQALRNKNTEKAEEWASFLKKTFTNRFYLEITRHTEKEGYDLEDLVSFGHERKIPLVAGHDLYYLSPDDKQAHDTLMSVQNNPDYGDISTRNNGLDLSFLSVKEIAEKFKDLPEAIENNALIADQCSLNLTLGTWVFPAYQTSKGKSHDDELRDKTLAGLANKKMEASPEIKARIEYELSIIKQKGYAPYFLVVADLLHHAHETKILTTTRGSAAGSLVSYLTGITNVDPIAYLLPFERFLNPERPSPPDIDMDIADNKRDAMIDYVRQKYGADRVAQIGTFGTMLARGAVRDVARALGYEYSLGDRIAKLIPFGSQGFPMTLARAIETVPELAELEKKEKEVRNVIAMSRKIEGCARHISVHAAGVVISPTPLTDYVALQYDPKGEGKIITQYDMHAVEDAGLLKFDFLGIKNLSILAAAVDLVEKIEGIKVDIENVPLDDQKTFTMLAKGETIGLFQLNGSGMTRYLKDLKPTTIHDINLMIALYRPGPMENIDEYIARKHGRKPAVYLHPKMKSYLGPTYGVLVYQDDLLMTAVEVAGYSWGEVDKFRKAVGKKIPKEMAKQHDLFVAGCKKHSKLSEAEAEKLWMLFKPFEGYGFNKAHAASYGKVAYQTAYMKANFPAIYMSAVLTADSGDVEKIGETISECKRMGIPVLPPDVNESFEGFTVVKSERVAKSKEREEHRDKIRFGLTTIKNFGEGIAHVIIEERKRAGKFKSLGNFLERVEDKNLNKKSLESLIKAGALDSFGERGVMLANLEQLLQYHKEFAAGTKNQSSLFGESSNADNLRLTPAAAATQADKLLWEKELLGLYISGHPLDKFKSVLEKRAVNIKHVKEEYREGMAVVLGGIIEELKPIMTKGNEQMAFLKLADLSGSVETVVFPRVFTEFKNLLVPEACIAVKGRVSNRNGEISILVEKIKKLDLPSVAPEKSTD